CFGGQRAIANPGTPIGTRTGLQSRTIAVDQHMRQRRAQRVDQRLGGAWHAKSDAVELGTPHRSDRITLALQPLPWRKALQIDRPDRAGKWHHKANGGAFARWQVQTVHESPRGIAEGVADL